MVNICKFDKKPFIDWAVDLQKLPSFKTVFSLWSSHFIGISKYFGFDFEDLITQISSTFRIQMDSSLKKGINCTKSLLW